MTLRSASNRSLRLLAFGVAVSIALAVFLLRGWLSLQASGGLGALCFIALVASCSADLRRVEWRTVVWGLAIQLALAILVLRFSIGGWRPGYQMLEVLSRGANQFLGFTSAGAEFVFGGLANQETMSRVFSGGYVFAFMGLPAIVFVSSLFSILYHVGLLQWVVRVTARVMVRLMRTSGAETLSVVADVFMGNTEAPLIVRPYVPRMTQSELLAVMVGGLATISGGMMAVYIGLGADPIAILTTSVMAAPASLYLAKILLPETGEPVTRGGSAATSGSPHANVIDAAASGASEGMMLALNVAAMLIAFLSLLAFVDYLLGLAVGGLSLAAIFATLFAPAAMLLGVPAADVPLMADLLGTKLVANEFVAYVKLTNDYKDAVGPRTLSLATFALTGFANFGSIGILLGGLGPLAPERRSDLARLSGRALFAGFLATLINASIASMLL